MAEIKSGRPYQIIKWLVTDLKWESDLGLIAMGGCLEYELAGLAKLWAVLLRSQLNRPVMTVHLKQSGFSDHFSDPLTVQPIEPIGPV